VFWMSDPDVLSNGGLARADNAALAEAIFRRVFPDRRLAVDEVHHGFEWKPDLVSALFVFPGVVPTAGVILFLLFLFWALSADWGGREALPELEQSRLDQVRNAARLLSRHGRHGEALAVYTAALREAMSEDSHLSRTQSAEELAQWFTERRPELAKEAAYLLLSAPGEARAKPGRQAILERALGVHRLWRATHDGVHPGTQGTSGGGIGKSVLRAAGGR